MISNFKRYFLLLALLLTIVAFFVCDGHHILTLENLRSQQQVLRSFVADYPVSAFLGFVILYILIVAASLPGASLCSLAAGLMFGQWIGIAIVVGGATIGATLLFLLIQTTLGAKLSEKAGPWYQKISAGFQDNAVSYMLFLRLVPLFPFFAVNIAGALMGIRLSVFFITTAVGILPGSFVFVSAGVGLNTALETGDILSANAIIALVGLGIISLVPVGYKLYAKRKEK